MSTKLKFSDDFKKLVFEGRNAKLKFSDTFKKLIFDTPVIDFLLTGENSFLLIGSGNSKLRI